MGYRKSREHVRKAVCEKKSRPLQVKPSVMTIAGMAEVASPPKGALKGAQRGDPDAFAALVKAYDRGLRALAYRLLGDRDRMEDALQEAYLRAYRGLPQFRGKAAVATWLYRIVYNVCLDELRRTRGAPGSLEDARTQPDPSPGPAEVAVTARDFQSALASLLPEERAAVLLVDAEGFSYEEAANVLAIPAGTLASRLHRARQSLRRVLGEEVT